MYRDLLGSVVGRMTETQAALLLREIRFVNGVDGGVALIWNGSDFVWIRGGGRRVGGVDVGGAFRVLDDREDMFGDAIGVGDQFRGAGIDVQAVHRDHALSDGEVAKVEADLVARGVKDGEVRLPDSASVVELVDTGTGETTTIEHQPDGTRIARDGGDGHISAAFNQG